MTPAEYHEELTAQRRRELRDLRKERDRLRLALHMITGQSVLKLAQSAIEQHETHL